MKYESVSLHFQEFTVEHIYFVCQNILILLQSTDYNILTLQIKSEFPIICAIKKN